MVQLAVPTVSAAVAAVLDVTVGVASESPAQPAPLSANKVLAVSAAQSVLVPVSVTVGVAPVTPELGDTESGAVATVTVPLLPSEPAIVRVPVPDPVCTTTVSRVDEVLLWLTTVTPETPDPENVVPLVQAVPVPVRV